MELMNASLIVHLKLQAGSVKINGPPMNYASGQWHKVIFSIYIQESSVWFNDFPMNYASGQWHKVIFSIYSR